MITEASDLVLAFLIALNMSIFTIIILKICKMHLVCGGPLILLATGGINIFVLRKYQKSDILSEAENNAQRRKIWKRGRN